MADVGVRVANIDEATIVDQIVGVLDGSVRLIVIERLVALLMARLGPTYATRAELVADLDWPDGVVGYVSGDTTAGYNGVYRKDGAIGAGSWTRVGDLPTSAVEAAQIAAVADGLAEEIMRAQAAEDLKAPLESPAFTGTPTAPDAPVETSNAQIATTNFVHAVVNALIAAAPGSLDTLNELAAALGDDPNFAATITGMLAAKAPLASPAFIGAPTAPTPAISDRSTNIATTSYVSAARDNALIASAILLKSVVGSDTITAEHTDAASAIPAGVNGRHYLLKLAASNTTSDVTLNVGGSGAYPVYDALGGPLAPDDLQGGSRVIMACMAGTSYRVISALVTPEQMRIAEAAAAAAVAAEAERAVGEEAAIWGRQTDTSARLTGAAAVPAVPVGLREFEPTLMSFDLCPVEGRWSDTGLPWAADDRYDDTVLFPRTITDDAGQEIVVTLWSYDLCPLAGYYAASGDLWPITVGTVYPEMVVETSADEVMIYYKSGSADRPTYVQHRMEHYVYAAENADVWRTDQPREAMRNPDGSFVPLQRIIQRSEVDNAVKLMGNVDFSGGKFHGNEAMTRPAVWMIDGVQIDPSAGLTYEPHRVELLQQTRMYDPGTTVADKFDPIGPAILELSKRHRWQNGEYALRTHVQELVDDPSKTIEFGFFLMCPVIRIDVEAYGGDGSTVVTHTASRSDLYEIEDVSAEGFAKIETTADRVIVWGDRYAAEWHAIEGWTDPSRLVYVDNRTAYNKIYPGFFRNGTHALAGEAYVVESAIRLTIMEGQ